MKDIKKAEGKEIVVLDRGIEKDAMPSGKLCCWGPLFAFRG